MEKIKVLELFGGIGACTKAFKRLQIPIEVIDYVEIDKNAVNSYNAINETNFKPQDITKWNKNIEVDFIMHGSPCQDFSIAGKQAGGNEGSGTRSSLMYETLRIVNKLKPKYVIWENVKNLISKRHKPNFEKYLDIMENYGYNSYYAILNAKDYGIPQNRERIYTISIRKDINKNFKFPEKEDLKIRLKDVLETNVNEKYYLSEEKIFNISHWNCFDKPFKNVYGNNSITKTLTTHVGKEGGGMATYCSKLKETTDIQAECLKIKTATKKGYDIAVNGDSVNLSYPNSTTRRGRVGHQVSQTLQCNNNMGVVNDLKIRKLTPKECWKLMGFDDKDFEKAEKVNSNAQLYKQAGNSIVVNVLEKIIYNIFKEEGKND